jgi:hypothetical protein
LGGFQPLIEVVEGNNLICTIAAADGYTHPEKHAAGAIQGLEVLGTRQMIIEIVAWHGFFSSSCMSSIHTEIRIETVRGRFVVDNENRGLLDLMFL